MPPKSKKEQEEEAKRLEEEQKRKEEEEARLAIERKKYAGQTLASGLFLPASNQIFIDLPHQPTELLSQKLRDAVVSINPNLVNDEHFIKLVLKELLYYAIDALSLYNLTGVKEVEGNQDQLLKARVLVGIVYSLMINQHPSIEGSGKSKQADEKLLKQILALHVSKGEGRLKVFNLKDVENVLICIKKGYFNHYLLLFNFNLFNRREDVEQTKVFINTATSFRNSKDTPFTDLSHKKEVKNESG